MAFDIEKLTLGEVAKVEELSGQSITAIAEDDSPKGNALAALAWVAKHREDPKFTWNQARGLTFAEANEILGMGDDEPDEEEPDEVDPTNPPEDSSPSTSGSKPRKTVKPEAPQE